MKVSYTIVPSGDLSGSLHFRVYADEHFDPDAALQHIVDYPTTQPTIVYIHDGGAQQHRIATFIRILREKFNCNITLVTYDERVNRLWSLVDRQILITTVEAYTGIPASEVHLSWELGITYYPSVAPVGQTRVYAFTGRDDYNQLVDWIRQAPYPIGVLTRPL
jgi:hypothetical protein